LIEGACLWRRRWRHVTQVSQIFLVSPEIHSIHTAMCAVNFSFSPEICHQATYSSIGNRSSSVSHEMRTSHLFSASYDIVRSSRSGATQVKRTSVTRTASAQCRAGQAFSSPPAETQLEMPNLPTFRHGRSGVPTKLSALSSSYGRSLAKKFLAPARIFGTNYIFYLMTKR